ncbi:hypothetical protein EON68_01290, partial [archaeon]
MELVARNALVFNTPQDKVYHEAWRWLQLFTALCRYLLPQTSNYAFAAELAEVRKIASDARWKEDAALDDEGEEEGEPGAPHARGGVKHSAGARSSAAATLPSAHSGGGATMSAADAAALGVRAASALELVDRSSPRTNSDARARDGVASVECIGSAAGSVKQRSQGVTSTGVPRPVASGDAAPHSVGAEAQGVATTAQTAPRAASVAARVAALNASSAPQTAGGAGVAAPEAPLPAEHVMMTDTRPMTAEEGGAAVGAWLSIPCSAAEELSTLDVCKLCGSLAGAASLPMLCCMDCGEAHHVACAAPHVLGRSIAMAAYRMLPVARRRWLWALAKRRRAKYSASTLNNTKRSAALESVLSMHTARQVPGTHHSVDVLRCLLKSLEGAVPNAWRLPLSKRAWMEFSAGTAGEAVTRTAMRAVLSSRSPARALRMLPASRGWSSADVVSGLESLAACAMGMSGTASFSELGTLAACTSVPIHFLLVLHSEPLRAELARVRAGWRCSACKVCEVCGDCDASNEALLLVCDGCDAGYHTFCCEPRLASVPDGAWFCERCGSTPPAAPAQRAARPPFMAPAAAWSTAMRVEDEQPPSAHSGAGVQHTSDAHA